jgi:NAD(P)-dependent dehydrogenase (short-subunit alcohol dehydrogenase family)
MGALDGKRVIITGASRGIGLATAERFLREGAEVIGVARNAGNLSAAEEKLKPLGEFVPVLGDVTDKATAEKVESTARERWGAVDLLINNAGIGSGNKSMVTSDLEDLERVMAVNVLGAHYMTHVLVPLLKKGDDPRVINVSSGAGRIINSEESKASIACYRLSKHTLDGMTVLYANALKRKVSVVALGPGYIRTDMTGGEGHEDPDAAAQRLLDAALLPFEVTGTYVRGSEIVGWP